MVGGEHHAARLLIKWADILLKAVKIHHAFPDQPLHRLPVCILKKPHHIEPDLRAEDLL